MVRRSGSEYREYTLREEKKKNDRRYVENRLTSLQADNKKANPCPVAAWSRKQRPRLARGSAHTTDSEKDSVMFHLMHIIPDWVNNYII